MKQKIRRRFISMLILCLSMMIGCSKVDDLENMSSIEIKDYRAITWNDKIYVPFCAVDNSDRGKQIGIVDNDEDDQVYEYKGYSIDEWLISFYHSGEMDNSMLMREINVKNIPKGLYSEYEWNLGDGK